MRTLCPLPLVVVSIPPFLFWRTLIDRLSNGKRDTCFISSDASRSASSIVKVLLLCEDFQFIFVKDLVVFFFLLGTWHKVTFISSLVNYFFFVLNAFLTTWSHFVRYTPFAVYCIVKQSFLFLFHVNRKLWLRFIEACRDQNSLFGISWMQLRSHLDALEMKKLYGLNPMAPEFVPKVIRAGQSSRAAGSSYSPSLIMSAQQYSLGLPPFYLPPPAPSTAAAASATAGIPPFPPPPTFYQQRLNPCSPHRQSQLNQSLAAQPHKPRPRILPFSTKSPNYSTPHLSGPIVPPPVVNHHSFGNLGAAPTSTLSHQLNSSFQVSS